MKASYKNFSDIVTTTGDELGLDLKAQGVASSSDRSTRQVATFVNRTLKDLLSRFPWSVDIGTNPPVLKTDGTFAFEAVLDDDIILIDYSALTEGARWRFLQAKGLAYDEEFRAYEKIILDWAYTRNRGQDVNTNVAPVTALSSTPY